MASSSGTAFKQDMPPPGGYEPINIARIPAKVYMGGWKLITAFVAANALGLYLTALALKRSRRDKLENNDAKLAIEPLLWAERDREFLKQIRKNRDEEEKLMANVPGWQTGTYYGEPVYTTVPQTDWINPIIEEYYAHAHQKHLNERYFIHLRQ